MEENIEKDVVEGRIYEVGYLLVPTLSLEEMPAKYGSLKELIVSFGGEVVSDEMPKIIQLAYKMSKVIQNVRSKFDSAYFGWIKFNMEGEKVLELKAKLDLDPNIIRFLILKTVKENTIAAKRFMHRDTPYRKGPSATLIAKKEGETEEVVPINKEEVDKEIDAMLAE